MPAVIESLPYMFNRAESSHGVIQFMNATERSQQIVNTQLMDQLSMQNTQEVHDKDRGEEVEDRKELSSQDSFPRRSSKRRTKKTSSIESIPQETFKGTIVDVKI